MKCATLFYVFFPTIATAENMIRFLFNNGNPTGSSVFCNSNDMETLAYIFDINYLAVPSARSRKDIEVHVLNFETDVMNRNKERELAYYPPHCKNNCKAYAADRCMATGCIGYRRNLGGKGNHTESRDLQSSTWCADAAWQIKDDFQWYQANGYFSKPCMSLLATPMKIECYNDMMYGVVESFSVYNSTVSSDILLKSNTPNGFNVCNSTRVAIEAKANDCVASVQFTLTGPNGYKYTGTENSSPFSLFSKSGLKLNGRILPVGKYNLSAVPDGYTQKRQDFTFNVVRC
jgi:hypothetical protein